MVLYFYCSTGSLFLPLLSEPDCQFQVCCVLMMETYLSTESPPVRCCFYGIIIHYPKQRHELLVYSIHLFWYSTIKKRKKIVPGCWATSLCVLPVSDGSFSCWRLSVQVFIRLQLSYSCVNRNNAVTSNEKQDVSVPVAHLLLIDLIF